MANKQPITNEFIPWAPWNTPLASAKVTLVSMGGAHLKNGLHQPFDPEFPGGDPTFREFPSVVSNDDLEITPSPFDPQYARHDINVIFPLERLWELAAAGYVGAVAPFAYSFLGPVTDPVSLLANYAPSVAYRMKRMGADICLIVAVSEADHQTAALVARAIELAGVPTVLLGTNRVVLEAVKAPRSVLVSHPDGATLGNPGNAGKHQHLLRAVFDEAWQFESPGLMATLPYHWRGME